MSPHRENGRDALAELDELRKRVDEYTGRACSECKGTALVIRRWQALAVLVTVCVGSLLGIGLSIDTQSVAHFALSVTADLALAGIALFSAMWAIGIGFGDARLSERWRP